MSRCFPYPPPGYALSSDRKDALIESIKLQKQKVKAEEPRKKEKKRDKKENKKVKKEKKDKRSQNLDNSDIVHSHFGGKFLTDAKADFSQKGFKAEVEQLERSSLTEEHAKPVCVLGPSSSSDSTENSNKRKRQPSPVDVSCGHGKIIRIRLSSKKQNQSVSPPVDEQRNCSTSGRVNGPPQIVNDVSLRQRSEAFCSTSGSTGHGGQSLVLRTGGERIHVASKKIKMAPPPLEAKALPAASNQIKTAPLATLQPKALPAAFKQMKTAPRLETKALPVVLTPLQKGGLRYQNLFDNWVPPQLHDACVDDDDEDWLFGSRNKLDQSEKRRKCRDEGKLSSSSISSCSNTLSLWPCAQDLPEVDLFALPFTVPF